MHLLERRALYNLIRMNWLNDPLLKVEAWQVEDYRALTLPVLFEKLRDFHIDLDQASFISYASECDSPEEFIEYLLGDRVIEAKQEDQIYLLIFELWRRLLNERPCLSILCNELDYQIFLHDTVEGGNYTTQMQSALANFALVLNENVDQGLPTQEAFKIITPFFANDIESFLYDYIFDLTEDNELYAQDLLDNFAPYLKGNKWFEFLYIRLIERTNHKLADKMLTHLMEDYLEQNDPDFNLEVIAYLSDLGKNNEFKELVLATLQIVSNEEDLQDLILLCMDFYHRQDKDKEENALQILLKARSKKRPTDVVEDNDSVLKNIEKILK